MDRIHHPSAIATPPSVDGHATPGYPTEGNPVGGQEATIFTAWTGHALIEEIRNVIVAAGMTPDKGTLTQLRDALGVLFGGGGGVLTMNGWQRLPGGLIIQWGQATTEPDGNIVVTFPIAFPSACWSLTFASNISGSAAHGYQALTAANFFLQSWSTDTAAPAASLTCTWIAVGV